MDYDSRHGYRGPEKMVTPTQSTTEDGLNWADNALDELDEFNGLIPAAVTKVTEKSVYVHAKSGENIEIQGDGLSFIQKTLNDKYLQKRSIKPGAIVRIIKSGQAWKIVQLPQVESALVSLDPQTGAVRALVGGFDFNRNKFNHVTQAWRQPGSSFKPFIYSASLEKGFTPASIIDDAPISISAEETGSGSSWEPKNFDNKYDGPIRLRTALTKSKNMVSIRILQAIGVGYVQDYITRFGFSPKDHPPYLAIALGAGSATPWQMAGAYAVFANGGFRVQPYLISKITDSKGTVIEQTKFVQAGKDAPRVIDSRNAFLMTSIMQDVARIGTAAKAKQLGRNDLAGKTGTTNNQVVAWFAGFNPNQVAITWMGFDHPRTLGNAETGAQAALPIWINYMAVALKGLPDNPYPVPEGISSIKIDPATGVRVDDNAPGISEYFYHEFPPPDNDPEPTLIPGFPPASKAGEEVEKTKADQLY
jgi:penicillin-binding protein 1A